MKSIMREEAPVYSKPIRDLEEDERPEEIALKHGVRVLSTSNLWALVLRTGLPGKSIVEICKNLMNESGGSLYNLERKTLKELTLIDGIGPVKALQILAIMEIVRRYNTETIGKKITITRSSDIYEAMRHKHGNNAYEEIWVMILNRSNQVIDIVQTTKGSAVSVIFDIKQLMKHLILNNAEGAVLVHNHPSGALKPSGADDQITYSFRDACKYFSIRLLDHVIITSDGYYSYCDEGRL